MTLRINSTAPDFTAETTQGPIEFHKWIGDGWAILFSHPKDFTPVCTTELGYMAGLKPKFDAMNTKIVGLSVDPVTNHAKWAKDIEETQGHAVTYPMIGDPELKVATAYDMLPEGAGTTSEGRTAADNATVRSVFIIGPDKKIKAMLTYPMSTGRNFDEVLRLLESCQLTAKHQVATPVNWKHGEDVIIVPAVNDEAAKAKYPERLEGAEALPAHRADAEVSDGKTFRKTCGKAARERRFWSLDPVFSVRFPKDSRRPLPIIGPVFNDDYRRGHDCNTSQTQALRSPFLDRPGEARLLDKSRSAVWLPDLARRSHACRLRPAQLQRSHNLRPPMVVDDQAWSDCARDGRLSSMRCSAMREP